MATKTLASVSALLAVHIAMSVGSAQEELPWYGYNTVDELTGETSYGVTGSIAMTNGGKNSAPRMGFRCHNDEPLFTFDPGRFVGDSSTDFTLLIWIDDNPRLTMSMRVWSNGTNGGFSRVSAFTGRLFAEMRAGYELRWRVDTSSWHGTGSVSLIGFTAASREFAAHCSL